MDAVSVANGITWLMGVYAAAGLLFATAFLPFGIGKVDPAALGAGVPFRLIILPGTVALWPVLLAKWVATSKQYASKEK